MPTPEFPPVCIVRHMERLHQYLASVTAALSGEPADAVEDMECLVECINANNRLVRGNRAETVPLSWSDLRLMHTGAMEICMASVKGMK